MPKPGSADRDREVRKARRERRRERQAESAVETFRHASDAFLMWDMRCFYRNCRRARHCSGPLVDGSPSPVPLPPCIDDHSYAVILDWLDDIYGEEARLETEDGVALLRQSADLQPETWRHIKEYLAERRKKCP